MLPLENYLFSATGPKPNQDTIPAGITLAGDFGFCFQCQVGSSLVLHRPIEITRVIGQVTTAVKIRDSGTEGLRFERMVGQPQRIRFHASSRGDREVLAF